MSTTINQKRLVKILVILTGLFVLAQILLLWVNAITSKFFDTAVSSSLTSQILHSKIFLFGLAQFIAGQLLLYIIFISIIWYLAISVGELFKLTGMTTYLYGILLFLVSIVGIFAANNYYAPHSFFANLVRSNLFNNHLSDSALKYCITLIGAFFFINGVFALINLIRSLQKQKNILRHSVVLLFILIIFSIFCMPQFSTTPYSVATTERPNIIIIGVDALRPDFLNFNHKNTVATPNIDNFLGSAIHFSEVYTPLPRTFPAWTSILTSTYPKHNLARGNNADLSDVILTETLPKKLQQAGYETIYSTDDTRFNNTNQSFGFDRIITPPMGLNDFLIGTINDFPLSNLIVTTPLGKLLFPYNYANHGAYITYRPSNFLQLLNDALQKRQQKPLFIAVHFTITHWPFYWFNDKQPFDRPEFSRYQAGIEAADKQIGNFLVALKNNRLLDHAVVILLSDHGMALGLRGERPITAPNYQGNPVNIKNIPIYRYATFPPLLDPTHLYGPDTSYGYGGDVLSLSQYHSVLGFQGYGTSLGLPHTVSGRVLLTDIAPTILDLLHLRPFDKTDGISLTPYFTSNTKIIPRTLYLESSFTLEEIEKEGISVSKVLEKTVKLYRMDKNTGLLFLKKNAIDGMTKNKQLAVMQGNWLLAHYPTSERPRMVFDPVTKNMTIKEVQQPARFVLVNLKTGAWTLELNTAFAHTAPLNSLFTALQGFYGSEIATTEFKTESR
jgi:arylsulfatase A-like enzyme